MSGKDELKQSISALLRALDNPQNGYTDEEYRQLSNALKIMLKVRYKPQISREQAARYLGISLRTLQRRVQDGFIPAPHRDGQRRIFWYIDELKHLK